MGGGNLARGGREMGGMGRGDGEIDPGCRGWRERVAVKL